jgi:uncharacterized protein (DUF1800 family)
MPNHTAMMKMQHSTLIDRHEQQRKALAAQQGREVYERTKAACPAPERLNLSPMKDEHQKAWEALRSRQQDERREAGIRERVQAKLEERNNRQKLAEREKAQDRLRKQKDRLNRTRDDDDFTRGR